MLSFLNPYMAWVKIIGAVIVIAAIWFSISTVLGWRADSHNLKSAVEQKEAAEKTLKDEQDCLVGSKCALRIINEANKAAEAVRTAQEDAARQNKEAKERAEAQANEYASQIAKATQQHQADLIKIMSHQSSPSCQEQRRMVITCPLD